VERDESPASIARERWGNAEWALLIGALVALGVALPTVPRLFPTDPSVLSVASEAGFSTVAAYRLALLWMAGVVAAGWLLARGDRAGAAAGAGNVAPVSGPARGAWESAELAIVAALVLLAFWPPFLAVRAPYVEDSNFLVALQRMHQGQLPYRDFEYLYGPLMLAPAHWFLQLTGFSARHYYAWLAVLEVLVAVAVVRWAQRVVVGRLARLAVVAVLLALLMNPLLGLNYNGVRRMLPVAGLLVLCLGRDDPRQRAGAALLVGLAIAYAHEQGLAALAAAGAVFALDLRDRPPAAWTPVVRQGMAFLAIAGAVWAVVAFATTGGAFPDYLREVRALVSRFSAGEAGFPFAWTLNAAALFTLLAIAGIAVGRGLATRATPTAWDRYTLAAFVLAVIALKSGLTRADMFHLDAGALGLALVFLVPRAAPRFGPDARAWRAGRVATVTVAATSAFGMLPTVSGVASGWLAGARAAWHHTPSLQVPFVPAAPALMLEHVEQDSATVALAAWLAAPARRNRPVLFYDRLWNVGLVIGVYKQDFLNDKFMYGAARGARERAFLDAHPDALVVIDRPSLERIRGVRPPSSFDESEHGQPASLVKAWAARVSSVHFDAVPVETRIHDVLWRRALGDDLRTRYDSTWGAGSVVVLERSAPAAP
jgi:hypothetical protein